MKMSEKALKLADVGVNKKAKIVVYDKFKYVRNGSKYFGLFGR